MKAKHQRLVLLSLAIFAVVAAVLLAMSALKDQAAYFYAPGDIARKGLPLDQAVRIGGIVRHGSIRRQADGVTIEFIVADETTTTIPVSYRGIVPDLFKEDSGVIAEGRFRPDGLFVASEILAKHDENYRPPQLAGDRHKAESLQ
jgi:cytochrome c-type biogenesis protein CcmE